MNFSKYIKEKQQSLKSIIGNYNIEIGVVDASKTQQDVKDGINNAQLLYIQEHGSPLNVDENNQRIPKRPVLQMTINYARKSIIKDMIKDCRKGIFEENWNSEKVEKRISIACNSMEKYARELIYNNDGRLKRNAESTIKAKGFNHPLFVTGNLAKSITCRYVKKD